LTFGLSFTGIAVFLACGAWQYFERRNSDWKF
jgi:hypothetical protein